MKKPILTLLIAVIGVVIGSRFIRFDLVPKAVHIEMKSNPYPLVIGSGTLFFSVLDSGGEAVNVKTFDVAVDMNHAAMISLYTSVSRTGPNTFTAPVIWSMAGEWYVHVTAVLESGETLSDKFFGYVYPTVVTASDYENQFRSESQNRAVTTDAEHEYVIIIPQGTQAMQLSGMVGEMVFPEEIRLKVSGKNTLVIRNNDLVTHTIGPYTVGPGELIRQTFSAPNTFVGVCTVGMSTVSIIIEE